MIGNDVSQSYDGSLFLFDNGEEVFPSGFPDISSAFLLLFFLLIFIILRISLEGKDGN